jgi:hypothetical protein
MEEIGKDTPASDFGATQEMRSGATPTQASQYLLFALSQLAGENGHHKFEQLCFQLAKRRIYSNVIPATGPVSAGGDQGADFETYRVGEVMPLAQESPFFGRVAQEKVVFACSIQKNFSKKIREDLSAAAHLTERVERVVFLTNRDIPVGKRHMLQEFALKTHGLALDIFDARAISDLLADPELFWIAQEYLSIPSDFVLAMPKSGRRWYEEMLNATIDPAHLIVSDFFRLKDAVRFATRDHAHQSDLPRLLTKLRMFQRHRSMAIQRRAFYEDFVASLRGLESVKGFEAGLQQYISAVALSDDPSELEDASVLISYCLGALCRKLLEVEISTIATWQKMILTRVRQVLGEPGIGSGRKCSLLYTQGYLLLMVCIDGAPAQHKANALDAAKSIAVWRKMIKEVRHAPMFPLERFGEFLSQFAGEIEGTQDFSRLVAETDEILSERFGKHKLAEQAFERAKSYYKAGRILKAIDELHMAHVESFTKETASNSVRFCIFLAKMYCEIKLYFAAKCYALGAAFAALKLEDDSLKGMSYRGLTEAASCDHASGASMEFFLTAKAFFFVSHEFSMSDSEGIRQFEWARIDFYSLILTRAASYIDESLYTYLKGTVLKSFGADEVYDESSSRLDDFFRGMGFQAIVKAATRQGIIAPFSDTGPRRRVGWQQLGVRWFIDWPNDYNTAQSVEGFCASLQILLADLRNTELSILPSDVFLSMDLHDSELEIEDVSDNERVSLVVRLPRAPCPTSGNLERSAIVQGVAGSALKMVSAMPHKRFIEVYHGRLKAGLRTKLSPYAEYDRLFREFYSEEDFSEHYEHSQHITLAVPRAAMETNVGLTGPTGLHAEYNKGRAELLIRKRYKLLAGQLKYTLPRLVQDSCFLGAVRALQQEGWKDWHILQGMASLRLNYLINTALPHGCGIDELKKASKELFERDEEESDPAPPVGLFTVSQLKRALRMSQLSTLKGLGFECCQKAPNFDAVNRFLQRFNYWVDDVAHPQIFPDELAGR